MTDLDRIEYAIGTAADLGNGFALVVAVDVDGGLWPWLVQLPVAEHATGGHRDVAHEQVGPLPPSVRQRLHSTPIRCGRRRLDGAPCRTPVARPGAGCHRHAAPTRTEVSP